MPRAENGWKVCGRCLRNFPVSEFWRHRKESDGFYHTCKECKKETKDRPPVFVDIDELCFLWPRVSARELAAKYCRTPGTIAKWITWLRRHGVKVPHRKPDYTNSGIPPFDREEFVKLANSKSISDVADELGLTYQTIKNRITKCRKEGYVINPPKGYYK